MSNYEQQMAMAQNQALGGMAGSPKREPEIATAIRRMENKVQQLEQAMEGLSQRLDPVLRTPPPSTAANRPDSIGKDACTRIGGALESFIVRLDNLSGRFNDLQERLEV